MCGVRKPRFYTIDLSSAAEPYDENDFLAFNGDVSRAITQVGLEIRRAKDEVTSVETFVVVNARGDSAAQLATAFSPQEVVFVKALIREIFTAPGNAYSLSTMNAAALGQSMQPELPASRVQAICKALIRQDWLQEHRGFYSLTLRALVELTNYLKSAFEEYVHACTECKDIVTKGRSCATPTCSVWVHQGCLAAYENQIRTVDRQQMICKGCKHDWAPKEVGKPNARARLQGRPSDDIVDESGQATPLDVEATEGDSDDEAQEEGASAEDEDNDGDSGAKRRRRAPARKQPEVKRRRRQTSDESQEAEEEEEEQEIAPLRSEEESDEIDSD